MVLGIKPTVDFACKRVLDLLAKDEQGRLYNIEVQTTRPLGLCQRLAYYNASLLVGQFESGGD
jgi:hypothetical protein